MPLRRSRLVAVIVCWSALCAAQARTTISDTLYRADGTTLTDTVTIAWPAFRSADGVSIAAGSMRYAIVAGVVNLALVPNAGATPSGTVYTARFSFPGTPPESWSVPATGPVTVAAIRVAVPVPVTWVAQQQITLGTGMGDLIGLWRRSTNPTAAAAGQLFYDTVSDCIAVSSNALSFACVSAGGGGGAPTNATYITQTPHGSLSAEQALSALATGILKSTTATGVLSIAVAGTDYVTPSGSITGNAATATALAANGANCAANQFPKGVDASGAAESCAALVGADLPGTAVQSTQGNTWSTGAQDFGAATSLKVPASAGAAPTASGLIAYDTTANLWKVGINAAGKTLATTDANITGTAANVTGVVAIANGGTGAATAQAAINALSQLTTEGDLLFRDATNSTRLARGTNGECLTATATTIAWGSCAAGAGITSLGAQTGATQTFANDTNVTMSSATNVHTLGWTGTLAKARQNAATVYTDQANTWSTGAQDFGAATSLKVPASAGAAPTASGLIAYDTTANLWKVGINAAGKTLATTDANVATATALAANGANCTNQFPRGVDASGAAESCASVAGSDFATQSANLIFGGPSSGGAAAPTFRSLVSDDIPNLPAAKITTGQLAAARGGTGIDSASGTGYASVVSGTWTIAPLTRTFGVTFDGGGSAITANSKADLWFPIACTIVEWEIIADQSGSIQFDLWKDTRASYPPTVADTITAAAKPLIASATNGNSTTLTGWTTAIAANDTIRVNVDSITTVTRVTLQVKVTVP